MKHDKLDYPWLANILVVDDDRRLLNVIDATLREAGYSCTVCSNASEAMTQFAIRNFALVITDLTMPGIDGLSVIAMIRSQSAIPILIVTGHSDEYNGIVGSFSSVTVLRKPYDVRVLSAAVNAILAPEQVLERRSTEA